MKRNLLLSTILVIIVSMAITGVALAQEDDPYGGEGYPAPTPPPAIDYEWPSDEGCTHHNWLGICDEWGEDEVTASGESRCVEEPTVIQRVSIVVQKSIMELIEGLRLMLRMR